VWNNVNILDKEKNVKQTKDRNSPKKVTKDEKMEKIMELERRLANLPKSGLDDDIVSQVSDIEVVSK